MGCDMYVMYWPCAWYGVIVNCGKGEIVPWYLGAPKQRLHWEKVLHVKFIYWTSYNFFSLSTSVLSIHTMKQTTLWTCNCYWMLNKRIVVKLLVYYLGSLCSCFHFFCVFLLNMLGFPRLLLSMGFMVCGKCCLKVSWLVRVKVEWIDFHGPIILHDLNRIGSWVVHAQ
jgi:hypothetical protein